MYFSNSQDLRLRKDCLESIYADCDLVYDRNPLYCALREGEKNTGEHALGAKFCAKQYGGLDNMRILTL